MLSINVSPSLQPIIEESKSIFMSVNLAMNAKKFIKDTKNLYMLSKIQLLFLFWRSLRNKELITNLINFHNDSSITKN